MKRAFDIVFSAVGLIVLLPVLAIVSLLLWATEGRPIFFLQERVGYRGKPFKIWKFRTMVVDAAGLGKLLTTEGDPRITPLGKWLRKTKLDELPQLLNVLFGEMSLVGPRPEVEKYVNHYTSEQRLVLELMPGITDAASIQYRNESSLLKGFQDPEQQYISTIVPDKIRLNLEYAEKASVLNDVGIILRTATKLFS